MQKEGKRCLGDGGPAKNPRVGRAKTKNTYAKKIPSVLTIQYERPEGARDSPTVRENQKRGRRGTNKPLGFETPGSTRRGKKT